VPGVGVGVGPGVGVGGGAGTVPMSIVTETRFTESETQGIERVEQILRPCHQHGERRDHDAEQVVPLRRRTDRASHNREAARGHVGGDCNADADIGGRDADVVDPRTGRAGVQQHRDLLLVVRLLVAQVHRDARDNAAELMCGTLDHHGRRRYLQAARLVARRWWTADLDRHGNRLRRQRIHVDLD